MIVVRDDRVGCSAHMNRKTCQNNRSIRLAEIEARILKVLQEHLLSPDIAAQAIEAYRLEHERLAKTQSKTKREAERDLAGVVRKIATVITAIENGGDPRTLALRVNELEAERRQIETRIASGGMAATLTFHPRIAERYRQKVADIRAALSKGDEAAREAVQLVRELIERIVVTPTDGGEPLKLELVGNISAVLAEHSGKPGAIVNDARPRNQLHSTDLWTPHSSKIRARFQEVALRRPRQLGRSPSI